MRAFDLCCGGEIRERERVAPILVIEASQNIVNSMCAQQEPLRLHKILAFISAITFKCCFFHHRLRHFSLLQTQDKAVVH